VTFTIPAIDSLDPDAVSQVQQTLAGTLAEAYPAVDFSRGAVHDLVLHLAAVLCAAQQEGIDRLRRSTSLAAIAEDPTLADDAAVDRLLSNFGIARLPGRAAVGRITVLLDAAIPVVVPNGAVFVADGIAFATTAAYSVRTAAAQATGPTDRVLTRIGDRYTFTVPVVATVVGPRGMIRRGAPVVPTFAIPHLDAAYADADFTGGDAGESNADLVARARRGVTAPVAATRAGIDALIHRDDAFPRCLQVSTIGAGDPELLRADRGVFPLLLPGRADVYARTADLPREITLTKQAVLVEPTAGGGVWQLTLDRDDAPGFYRVTRVAPPGRPPGEGGLPIVVETRGVDLSGPGWHPDLAGTRDGAYSRYQTAVVRFLDDSQPLGDLAVGATRDYAVAALVLPDIAAVQAFLGDRDRRPLGGDVLVRAPVPCFLSVSFEVRRPAAAAVPDTDAIRAAVAAAVNRTGFAGRLAASTVVEAILPALDAHVTVGPIDLFGRVRRPDGTIRYLRDTAELVAPHEPDRMVTARTTCFFLDPADVAVSVRIVDAPDT
jgi:hypothetical protein